MDLSFLTDVRQIRADVKPLADVASSRFCLVVAKALVDVPTYRSCRADAKGLVDVRTSKFRLATALGPAIVGTYRFLHANVSVPVDVRPCRLSRVDAVAPVGALCSLVDVWGRVDVDAQACKRRL
ncbi:unnamed protein product [Chrysodeixis includens]|uniref:Uncharacterized protein n=1 Tax=Chrysodeixis includens TaxID=689277 RepID=A0A9N8Q202_CHRIL|nr:unnamed protein product [Chrysodeixis includens]